MTGTMTTVRVAALMTVFALLCGAESAARATDPPGQLMVESEPAGAVVYVDGRLAGQTPLTLPTVDAGAHRVRVVHDGFLENSRLVTIKSGARAMLQTQLTPAPQQLKIVVVEGEGAVNIIQQKTAVAPVIEVRDRNDQPVSGAVVKFAIQKGKASFDGVRTLSVTTDALGRATATGLTPSGTGALQIGATATFQGQSAAIAIAQTNVATAAQAAAAASGTGAASGGGGMSHLAIAGIVGGAGAGIAGAVVASKRVGMVTSTTFSGPLNGQVVITRTIASANGTISCVSTRTITGTMTLQIDQRGDGTATGFGTTNGAQQETAITPSLLCTPSLALPFTSGGPVTGTGGNITYGDQQTLGGDQIGIATINFAFNGVLSAGVITGTMSYRQDWNGPTSNGAVSGGGSTTFSVTLR